ncbi:hypothetical protein [Pedobacter sp.]|uniref:hypothetical protein n=1 Tax=Pedobacter sp. TaxID=1411316 RepID=UPI003D7FEDA1
MDDEIIHNPTSNSGIGFHLEHWVQTGYLASLLLGTPVPFKGTVQIISLEFQARRKAQTDDLIIRLSNDTGSHFLQSKKGLEINNNKVFNDLIKLTWEDYLDKDLFVKGRDKFIFTTDQLSKTDINDTLVMLDWLRFSSDLEDFKGKIAFNKSKAIRFNYFKEAVSKASIKVVKEKEVYAFIKHIYIQGYDYLTIGSRDKDILIWSLKNYLNEGITGVDAVNQLLNYVSLCNANAAKITTCSIDPEIKKLFNLTGSGSISNNLASLLKKSSISLEHTIFSDINGFHVERTGIVDQLIELVEENQLTVLVGEPGTGKSALFKDLAKYFYSDLTGFIFFKADSLDRDTLAETMADIQVPLDFETLINQWLILPRLVIYIDSLEKLYESDKKGAFLELIGIVSKYNKVKIISSCRTFALSDLTFKFRLDRLRYQELDIPDLQDSELLQVKKQFPSLSSLIDNPKLGSIIKKPFYLNIAIRVISGTDGGSVDLATFKKHLLERGIQRKGDSLPGISAKRLAVFSQLVLDRAKSKKQFSELRGENKEEIVAALLADNLLVEGTSPGQYAPAHDVFEDIIVDNYFDELYLSFSQDIISFMKSVEPYPVLRRGLRWWIISRFEIINEAYIKFIKLILSSHEINKYTRDEIFLAFLYTRNCGVLLEHFNDHLLTDGYPMLKRLILLLHINFTIKTAPDSNNQTIKTNGPGWLSILTYIERHDLYDPLALSIYRLIDKASLSYPVDGDLPGEALIIAKATLRHIADIEKETKDFAVLKGLYKVLFRLTNLVQDELRFLIDSTVNAAEDHSSDDFFEDLAEVIINDTTSCIQIYRYFPDQVIRIFNALWLNDKEEKIDSYENRFRDVYSEWGLIDHRNTHSGPSAYSYPTHYLLKFHPTKTIEFLIGFINNGVLVYNKSESKEGHVGQITFKLENGDTVTQIYNSQLWSLYRGLGNMPEIMQSFHMALEDFLLSSLDQGTGIKDYAIRLITQSKSVSTTAVIASVLMKYPFALGKEVLSFLKVKEFYELDFNRKTEDMFQLSMGVTPNNPHFANERMRSNALQFRQGDFEQMVLVLQVYGIGELDSIIDDLKKLPGTKNSDWQFRFHRMDKREREIVETETALLLNPKPLPKKLQKIAASNANDENERKLSASYIWATNAFKEEKVTTLEEWRNHYANCQLKSSGMLNRIMQPQALVAALGIRDHLLDLNSEEFNFATKQLVKKLNEICAGFRNGHWSVRDLMERPLLQIFPFVLHPQFDDIENISSIRNQLIELLLFIDKHYIGDFVIGIQKNGWQYNSAFCTELAKISINLYDKADSHQQLSMLFRNEDPMQEANFSKLVNELTTGELSFEPENEHESRGHYDRLQQGLLMIPFPNLSESHFQVIKKMYEHFIVVKRHGTTFTHEKKNFGIYVGDFLSSESDFAKPMLEFVLEKLSTDSEYAFKNINNMTLSGHDKKYPIWFWQRISRLMKYFLETNAYNGIAFALFFGEMPAPLNVRYKVPNEDIVRNVYKSLITSGYFDDGNIGSKVFRFLSSIGSTFQPDCLDWLLTGSLKFNNGLLYQSHEDLERFVKQLYDDHLPYVLSRRELKEYFLRFLEFLIDRESVTAFRIREEIY